MLAAKLNAGPLEAAGLVSIAIAHGLAIVITVAATANISGGHVNPAVTFGLAVGGHITVLRAALYWIAQLLGATLASYLLQNVIASVGEVSPLLRFMCCSGFLLSVGVEEKPKWICERHGNGVVELKRADGGGDCRLCPSTDSERT